MNTQEEKDNMGVENDARDYHPSLDFYHPNARGTGSAVKFRCYPAHDNHSGFIMMSMSPQKSVPVSGQDCSRKYATFDYDGSVDVALDLNDIAKMLQVFRGETESIDDGKGLYHHADGVKHRIIVRHLLEPVAGYSIETYEWRDNTEKYCRILIHTYEALALSISIESMLGVISFGIPSAIPHA